MESWVPFFIFLNWFLTAIFTLLLITVLIRVKNNASSKFLLILILLFQVYAKAILSLKTNGLLFDWAPFLYRSGYPFELATAPLIFLYIVSVTNSHFELKKVRWPHFLPFIFGCSWYFFVPLNLSSWEMDKYIRTILAFIIAVPYMWASQKAVTHAQIHAENQRSSLVELNLPWLRFLLFTCYAALVLKFLDVLTGPKISLDIYSGVLTNLALIGLTYYGLGTSPLFKQDEIEDVPRELDDALPTPTERPALTSAEMQKLGDALLKLLKDKELFLRPQIRLVDVANEMGLKSYKLTDVINQGLQTNFYELINGLRIQRAQELLIDPSKDHLNLLGIGMDSGFNSKSVFNDHFRRITGVTPSDFRQKRGPLTESSN